MGTLNQLYEVYCGVASDLKASRSGARRDLLQEKADEIWLQYIEQGGGREPWHAPAQPWAYQDGFVEMRHSSPNGPVDRLRELLNIPRNVGSHFMAEEQTAVGTFQRNHHLSVTGIVDRKTWQLLLEERGERKPAELRNVFELPGSSARPVPIVLRERRHWVLALDDVEDRTYANHHNLALMAVLSYADISGGEHVEKEMHSKWNAPRLREDVLVKDKTGTSWPLFVRESRAKQLYEYRSLSDDATHTQGFVLGHPSHIVIAIRGTEFGVSSVDALRATVADLNSDLGAQAQTWMFDDTLKANAHAKVHKGFYTAFESIREQLASHLSDLRRDNPRKPIFVTGHSLGGAVACLTACYLRSHREFSSHPLQLYTYAQPRVGTLAFAQHYWTNHSLWRRAPSFRYHRTAHLFDPITMIPSAYLADNVADVADVLIEYSSLAAASKGPVEWALRQAAAKTGKQWIRAQLEKQCDPKLDYRHFGVPVLCIQNAREHPFVVQAPASSRLVEDASIPRLQTVHEERDAATSQRVERVWDHLVHIAKHFMESYLSHTLHAFEHSANAYLAGDDVFPPLSGAPALPMYDRQLFHRFVHQHKHVEAHALEQGPE